MKLFAILFSTIVLSFSANAQKTEITCVSNKLNVSVVKTQSGYELVSLNLANQDVQITPVKVQRQGSFLFFRSSDMVMDLVVNFTNETITAVKYDLARVTDDTLTCQF